MSKKLRYSGSRGISNLLSDKLDPNAYLSAHLGPSFDEYRKRWDQARAFQQNPPFPLHVDYEMMFSCNLRCPMCVMSLEPDKRQSYGQLDKRLSAKTVAGLIDQGAEAGQMAMGFGGLWEPLLSPDIATLVAHGRERGLIDVMFNTNGLLLSDEVAKNLIKAGLTRLMISLDAATEETYNLMRPGSDFKQVKENIVNFLRLRQSLNSKLPLLRLSFCRTAVNEHELERFLEDWQDKADFFSVQNYGRYEGSQAPGFPSQGQFPLPAGRCAQPHKRLLVRHNGDVLPCCDASAAEGLIMGNIKENTLMKIWQGEKIAFLRLALEKENFCGQAAVCRACRDKFKA